MGSLNPCFSGGWSRSKTASENWSKTWGVLILVLVEDGLGEAFTEFSLYNSIVLILVLVEDGLGDSCKFPKNS